MFPMFNGTGRWQSNSIRSVLREFPANAARLCATSCVLDLRKECVKGVSRGSGQNMAEDVFEKLFAAEGDGYL